MNIENIQLFERYFNHEMGEVEEKEFKQRLKEDDSFHRDFKEYESIYEAIGDREVIELRRHLRRIGRSMREDEKKNRFRRDDKNWFWLAALFIISLSIVSITYLWVNSSITTHFQGIILGARNIHNQIYSLEPASEELLSYRVRCEDFQMEHPGDTLIVGKNTDIRFTWQTHILEPLYLDVLNKNGKLVYSSKSPVRSPFLFRTDLPRGVYIYRFRTSSHALYLGLIYVL